MDIGRREALYLLARKEPIQVPSDANIALGTAFLVSGLV
jgi:hypothetical protein